jgi:KAP-like P-loop domain-containing protein
MTEIDKDESGRSFIEAQIVPDEVVGKDEFAGSGHSRTAKSLATTIQGFDEKDAAIGLEAQYGAGKSVVIALTQELLESNEDSEYAYKVFTFDLWSNHAERFRRGYLEELLAWAGPDSEKLIKKNTLEKFRDKIRDRTVEISTENRQEFHWFAFVLLIAAPLLPLVIAWASPMAWNGDAKSSVFNVFGILPFEINGIFFAQLLLLILYLVFCLSFIVAYFRGTEDQTEVEYEGDSSSKTSIPSRLNRALINSVQPFRTDKAQTEKQTQSIREEDPSTLEFQKLFRAIIQSIQIQSRRPKPIRVVLVFDNIDRLPAARIPEVWAEMRSIFASTPQREIAPHGKVTAIVPFDQLLIDKAFSNADTKGSKTSPVSSGRVLVEKTFAAVLRVAPPVGFDSREFFFAKLDVALPGLLSDQQKWTVHRLFELNTLQSEMPPSPRQIIAFVNKIVVLWNERRGDVPIESLALYAISSDRISNDPSIIFDSKKIDQHADLVSLINQPKWEIHLAAIYYNVQVDHVLPILMYREIESAFVQGEENKINQLQTRTHFEDALSSFAERFKNSFQIADLQTYAKVIQSFGLIESESPSIKESWRTLLSIEVYGSKQERLSSEVLVALAQRFLNRNSPSSGYEIPIWVRHVFEQELDDANFRANVFPALEIVAGKVSGADRKKLNAAIQARASIMKPEQALILFLLSNTSEHLSANVLSKTPAGFETILVEALVKRPVHVPPLIRSSAPYFTEMTRKEVCTKLFQRFSEELENKSADNVSSAIWACIETDQTLLDAANEARSQGNLVLAFKYALENEFFDLAAKLFLLECLDSKTINTPAYGNRGTNKLGTVHDAMQFYNQQVGDASEVSDQFIATAAKQVIAANLEATFVQLVMQAGEQSAYHRVLRRVVRDGGYSDLDWSEYLAVRQNVRSILGDDLFTKWVKSIAQRNQLPTMEIEVSQQVQLCEDIEEFQLEGQVAYLKLQNDRLREQSEDDWRSTLQGTNVLLPMLNQRLNSSAEPLSNLALSARLALLGHLGETLDGQEDWNTGLDYDALFRALNSSSKTELLSAISVRLAGQLRDASIINKFAEEAPDIFWALPLDSSPDDFIRNVVSPLLETDPAFLLELVKRRKPELKKVLKSAQEMTATLIADDLTAAETAAESDASRLSQIKEIIEAFKGAGLKSG